LGYPCHVEKDSPCAVVRMTGRFRHTQHRSEADIGILQQLAPLRARPGGVLRRAGQTEGSVDLARLAELKPAGVI